MEDYIKKQIDMIGEMLLLLTRKLRQKYLDDAVVPLKSLQEEMTEVELRINLSQILTLDHPVAYMVEDLQFSNEAVERFVELVMRTDAPDPTKTVLLEDAVTYLDSKGYFSFSLHSMLG